MDAFFKIKLQD